MVNGWVRRATYATFCTALLFYVFNLLRNKHCNQKQRNTVAWQLSCCGLPTMLRKKLHEFAAHFITPLSPALQLAKQINASDWPVSPRFIKKKWKFFTPAQVVVRFCGFWSIWTNAYCSSLTYEISIWALTMIITKIWEDRALSWYLMW